MVQRLEKWKQEENGRSCSIQSSQEEEREAKEGQRSISEQIMKAVAASSECSGVSW